MRYKIYAKDGKTVRAEAATLEYSGVYMGERLLTVTVKSPYPVSFAYGDYIDYRGERFTLRNVPSEKRQARSYTDGEAMVYEGLRFAGYYAELSDVQMCDIVLSDNGIPYTGLGTFSFYVSKAEDFGDRLQANLDRAYGKGTWTVAYGEGVEINGDKAMSIGGDTSCYDALVQFANDFDVNFTTKGRTITLGTAQTESSRTYIYGKGNGLKSLTRTADANQRIVTKLRAYGSTKNVPYDYYNKVSGEVRSGVMSVMKGVRGGKTCYGVHLELPDGYLEDTVTIELPGGMGTFTGSRGEASEGDEVLIETAATMMFYPELMPPRDYKGKKYQQATAVGSSALEAGTYHLNTSVVNLEAAVTAGSGNWEITCALELWDGFELNRFLTGNGGSSVADIGQIKITNTSREETFADMPVEVFSEIESPTAVAVMTFSGNGSIVKLEVETETPLQFYRDEQPGMYFIHICDGADDSAYEAMYDYLGGKLGPGGVEVTVTGGVDKENVPSKYLYYDRLTGSGRYVSNLMLPGYPEESLADWVARVSAEDTDTGRRVKALVDEGFMFSEDPALPYIVSPRAEEYGVKEGEVIFDGSDEDWDEVCPSMEGMTTAELSTVPGYAGSETYNGGGELDRILGGSEIEDNGVSATGGYGAGYKDTDGVQMKSSSEVTIPNVGFDLWGQLADGQTPVIYMNSGMCAGRKFEILRCVPAAPDDASKGYRLTVERELDEAVNMYYPNKTFSLSAGDRYVVEGIEMPGVYVKAASVRVFFEAVEWLKANDHAAYTYQPEMDNLYLARNPGYGAELVEGMKMSFTDAEMGIGLQAVTISQLVIKEGEADIAQYEVTLDDEAAAELLTANLAGGQVQGAGGTAGGQGPYVIKTGDSTPASDSNVFSALRSQATFLRKDKDDLTPFKLTMMQGGQFGDFASGMSGFGGRIDGQGNGEMESLVLRRFLEVPELRFNRVDIKVGDKWRAPGGGVTASVDAETRTVELKLEDGEIGAVAVGDICMGIYHSQVAADNATSDSDDGLGNRTFAGFTTVYFTITEVTGERNEKFKYQLRPVSERWKGQAEPFEMMTFVAYGNFTDEDRQTSVYETRTYTRMLWKQNTWEISKGNVALQYGDLSNLSVFGMSMAGYSMYLNNVYFTGTVTQVKPDGTPVKTANDRGAWQAGHYDYYDRVSHDGRIWLCVAEDGTDSEPAEGNADWLLQVDKGGQGEPGQPGADGEGMTNCGQWKSGMTVPKMGVVKMGDAVFLAKVATANPPLPPLWTLTDPQGNRLTDKEGYYLLTGEVNTEEYELLVQSGADGKDGAPGVPGKDGADGKTLYTWIRYADDAEGGGISNDPTGKAFIGFAYNKESPLESDTPGDYQWSDIKGEQGVPGEKGADGTQYYTWVAYSDNADGNPMYQQPTASTKYIGIAVNKTTQQEGTDPSEYTWSLFRGADGEGFTVHGQWKSGMTVPKNGVVSIRRCGL